MVVERSADTFWAIAIKVVRYAKTSDGGFVSRSGCLKEKGPVNNVDLAFVLLRAECNKNQGIAPLVGGVKATLSYAVRAVVPGQDARGRGRACSFSRSARRWRGPKRR
jgi:hypothetical protein